jgi:CTP-dependent riboflavin kinase
MGLAKKGKGKKVPLKTNLDRAYESVLKSGKLNLEEFSQAAKVSSEEAEKWAKLLQDEGLVQLNYPLFGEITVSVEKEKDAKPEMTKNKKLIIFGSVSVIVVAIIVGVLIWVVSS